MKRLKLLIIAILLLFCLCLPSLGAHASSSIHWQWWSYGNNQWGYTMQPQWGHTIRFSPLPAPWDSRRYFCVVGTFDCAYNFWFENGYVEQCRNGVFDKLGGMRNACQSNGGYWRTLYWQ